MVLNVNEEPITVIQYSSTYTYLTNTCARQCFMVHSYHNKHTVFAY